MARIDWVDRRLREWAAWLTSGDGSGYATVSPLHPGWSPPSPGMTPTIRRVRGGEGRSTHASIRRACEAGLLSTRLVDTLVVHYCYALPVAEQAQRLECQPATVDERIRVAHARLARLWGEPAPGVLRD